MVFLSPCPVINQLSYLMASDPTASIEGLDMERLVRDHQLTLHVCYSNRWKRGTMTYDEIRFRYTGNKAHVGWHGWRGLQLA